MQEEDYEILRNEANAEPARYAQWDQAHRFRTEYQQRHPSYEGATPRSVEKEKEEEPVPPLSRQSSTSSTSSVSSTSAPRHGTHSPELQEIRTAPQTQERPARHSRGISSASAGGPLYRHPTERHPEAIKRIETHRSQHQQTVGARVTPSTSRIARITRTLSRRRTERPIPSLGAGKPYPPPLPDREEYVVEYDGVDDPLHAQNWSLKKKLGIGSILAFDALAATMGSSIFSAAIAPVSETFGVIQEVGTLGTSLFVFGYAFGPLVSLPFPTLHQVESGVAMCGLYSKMEWAGLRWEDMANLEL
jgi:DHA1 family multidrug resistance protein-like MFS transporter